MRVLWVDADKNPWTESSGWQVLEDFGVKVHFVPSTAEALSHLIKKNYDLLLVRVELDGAPGFLVEARKFLAQDPRRVVLASSEWSKEQFKIHSKSDGAAHRYARVPMPPEGFLGLAADLFACTVEELRDFDLSAEEIPAPAHRVDPVKKSSPRKAAAAADTEDAEVLRKYLRIKEEQLEISDGEREELALENERIQKEAHLLQVKVRELEHLHEEISKKLGQVDEENQQLAREKQREAEERERADRHIADKLRKLETQAGENGEKYENLRVRVRKDIRKIRENERDLEARLELLRKDSETLLQARDEKVLEMQRKIDALEFDLDQVQDSRVQAQMEAERYLAKLSRVARALHIAVSMIEEDNTSEAELDELEPLFGGAANVVELKSTGDGSSEGGESGGPAGRDPVAQAQDSVPDQEGRNSLAENLEELAASGEATQMISTESLHNMGGEPESSSG
jgi:hypothetical protein